MPRFNLWMPPASSGSIHKGDALCGVARLVQVVERRGPRILRGRPSSVKGARSARVAARPPAAALDPGASATPPDRKSGQARTACPLGARPTALSDWTQMGQSAGPS